MLPANDVPTHAQLGRLSCCCCSSSCQRAAQLHGCTAPGCMSALHHWCLSYNLLITAPIAITDAAAPLLQLLVSLLLLLHCRCRRCPCSRNRCRCCRSCWPAAASHRRCCLALLLLPQPPLLLLFQQFCTLPNPRAHLTCGWCASSVAMRSKSSAVMLFCSTSRQRYAPRVPNTCCLMGHAICMSLSLGKGRLRQAQTQGSKDASGPAVLLESTPHTVLEACAPARRCSRSSAMHACSVLTCKCTA